MREEQQAYYFRLRTLADPEEHVTFEAGPFNAREAGEFAQAQAIREAMRTGRPWVVDYVPAPKRTSPELRIISVLFIVLLVVAFVAAIIHNIGGAR